MGSSVHIQSAVLGRCMRRTMEVFGQLLHVVDIDRNRCLASGSRDHCIVAIALVRQSLDGHCERSAALARWVRKSGPSPLPPLTTTSLLRCIHHQEH